MLKPFASLLADAPASTIENALQAALDRSDESPFWSLKVMPLAHALLSVLIPLRDTGLLFDPEGNPAKRLDAAMILRWCDLVSLKTLAFTLQKSNENGRLMRTRHDQSNTEIYRNIELSELGRYLNQYGINLDNEALDFPIAHYNLHLGIADVLAKLMK